MTSTAVFRFDASPDIGGGHAARSGQLAAALRARGWHIDFVVSDQSVGHVAGLDHPIIAHDAASMMAARIEGCDVLCVDHYGLDAAFETACRGWAKHVVVIDDLADRPHDADVLVDMTYGRAANDYAALMPQDCRMLLGPGYALLDPVFALARTPSLERRKSLSSIERIFISFGLMDPVNMTVTALEGVRQSGFDGVIDIAIGSSARHLDTLRQAVADIPTARLHVEPDNLIDLMTAADVSIGAAGGMSWERCALGLPSLTVVIADNQLKIAEELARAGAIVSLGWYEQVDVDRIASAVTELIAAPDRVKAISDAAANICDGLGAERVAEVVEGLCQ